MTSVAICDLPPLPRMRSPFQWPGTARSAVFAGRLDSKHHAGDPGLLGSGGAVLDALDVAGAQGQPELGPQLATDLAEQRPVDRLVGPPHRLVVRVVGDQPAGNLLR